MLLALPLVMAIPVGCPTINHTSLFENLQDTIQEIEENAVDRAKLVDLIDSKSAATAKKQDELKEQALNVRCFNLLFQLLIAVSSISVHRERRLRHYRLPLQMQKCGGHQELRPIEEREGRPLRVSHGEWATNRRYSPQ